MKTNAQTELDKAVAKVMSRPLSGKELSGFGKAGFAFPDPVPYVKIVPPSKEDGEKGWSFEVGVKGTFGGGNVK